MERLTEPERFHHLNSTVMVHHREGDFFPARRRGQPPGWPAQPLVMTQQWQLSTVSSVNKKHFSSAKGVEIHTWPISPPNSSGSRLQRDAFGFIASDPSWLPGLQETADSLDRTQRLLPGGWSCWARNAERSKSLLELNHTLSKNTSWFDRDQHEEVLVDRC